MRLHIVKKRDKRELITAFIGSMHAGDIFAFHTKLDIVAWF